jgi:hypothetical protein
MAEDIDTCPCCGDHNIDEVLEICLSCGYDLSMSADSFE